MIVQGCDPTFLNKKRKLLLLVSSSLKPQPKNDQKKKYMFIYLTPFVMNLNYMQMKLFELNYKNK